MSRPYICKIRTDRLRKLSIQRLRRTQAVISHLSEDAWETGADLASRLVTELEQEKLWRFNAERATSPGDRQAYQRFADQASADAKKLEHKIWNRQMTTGCKIPEYEQVARDADREGQHITAEVIRKQRSFGRRRRT
jgi:hypothetical protein